MIEVDITQEDMAMADGVLQREGCPEEGCVHLRLVLAVMNRLGVVTGGQEGSIRCPRCNTMVGT